METWIGLYEALVKLVLLYGAGSWELNSYQKMNNVHNRACKSFLGVGKRASNLATRPDMGWSTYACKDIQTIEATRFWCRIQNMVHHRIPVSIHKSSLGHKKSWDSRMCQCLERL